MTAIRDTQMIGPQFAVENLKLSVFSFDRRVKWHLLTLKLAPALRSLAIESTGKVVLIDVQVLAELKDSPTLRILTLNLDSSRLSASGAKALSDLKDAPNLHTLHLSLDDNKLKNA